MMELDVRYCGDANITLAVQVATGCVACSICQVYTVTYAACIKPQTASQASIRTLALAVSVLCMVCTQELSGPCCTFFACMRTDAA